ncbi:hypothetical protein [Azohydromonas lata]|uniref:Uncharacterized protein n=1 Tax=Azohydromonas lata TaxID=45677 RepID=A0ABU5IKU3_9BURK|nr:hypothetical protein [Azohydromonas lata]MDZ5459515.1 hypothetical protein [Azohydromonas lata]
MSMKSHSGRGVAIVLLAGAVLAGCGGADSADASRATPAAEQAAAASAQKPSPALERALALAHKTNDARVKSERVRRGEAAR